MIQSIFETRNVSDVCMFMYVWCIYSPIKYWKGYKIKKLMYKIYNKIDDI